MYVELITILVRAKDDITRACRRCQSTLYIVFNIAKVGGPHYGPITVIGSLGFYIYNVFIVRNYRVLMPYASRQNYGLCLPLRTEL